jgi:hypothetical protein
MKIVELQAVSSRSTRWRSPPQKTPTTRASRWCHSLPMRRVHTVSCCTESDQKTTPFRHDLFGATKINITIDCELV